MTLLDHLEKLFPTAKRTTLRRMIESGRVRVNGLRARTLKQPIDVNAKVEVVDSAPRASERPAPLTLPIVFEDEHLLVIDKPAGLITSTGPREKRPTAIAKVREHVRANNPAAPVGLIHRLDRDASGLLVFSKNHEAYLSLKRQLKAHSIDRIYIALVHGTPSPDRGKIDSRLIERADGTVRSTDVHAEGERAISTYETIWSRKKMSLVRITLFTGKKHQIRVHMSERGWPIVNDPMYGEKKSNGRLMLAAVKLALDHPATGERVTFEINAPKEMEI